MASNGRFQTLSRISRASLALVCVSFAAAVAARAQSSASFRGGPAHAASYDGGGANIIGMQWRFLTGGDVVSSPAVANNIVYVGSGDGLLYAIDLLKGTKLWTFNAGNYISSSPTVVGNAVFFGTFDGHFFAVDARTGAARWKLTTGALLPFPWGHESGDRYTSSPTVIGGTVYVGAGDGFVYAIDAAAGKVKWRAKTGGRVRGSPAVDAHTVFVGSFDGRVYAFDTGSGKERWHYDTEGTTLNSASFGFDRRSIQSSPALANGTVFIGARDGFVYAIDAVDGKLRWRYDHKVSWINSSPAVANGVVYDGSSDGHFVQALDASSGKELWRTEVGTTVWSSPAVATSQIYVGDGAGRLLVLDRATGKLLGFFRTGAGAFSSPAVAGNLVVIGSNDGSVYAVRVSNALVVHRAVFLDSAYIRAGAGGRSGEIAAYLSHRGYDLLDPKSLGDFLQARARDSAPSVVVFATEHLPAALATAPLHSSPLRAYLAAGGKVVWTGTPPLLWSLNDKGNPPGLEGFQWNAPTELLDVDHQAAIFDDRGVRTNEAGMRWGLPRTWRSAWSVNPSSVTQTLALDDWGLAAAWVKSYGGPPGTGFVRVGDDPLAVYLAAEYRPMP